MQTDNFIILKRVFKKNYNSVNYFKKIWRFLGKMLRVMTTILILFTQFKIKLNNY